MGEARRREEKLNLGEAAKPQVASDDAWAIAGGMVFLLVCMLLPLVGRAGALTPYYGYNMTAFVSAVFLGIALSGTALVLKLRKRSAAAGAFPWASAGMVGVNVALILMLILGLLRR